VVVGLGGRGLEWARTTRSNAAFDLAGCVEPDSAARARAQSELGVEVHAELGRALASGAVQAVLVATPPEHHEGPCRAALERGLAVLVEKPFTLDLDTAAELVELAEARTAPLLVAQSYRFLRAHRAARAVVRSGRLGAVRQVSCRHYRTEPDPGIPVENGTLWDIGVHHLDALRDMLGDEPVGVLATGFDDGLSVQVLLEFASGARASYSATRRSSGHEFFEGGKEHYLRVTGDRGTLHMLNRWLVLCESGRLPRLLRRGPRPQSEESLLLDQLAAALRGAPPSGVSGRGNIGTMTLLDACVRSAAERSWVTPRAPGGDRA
jgi:predicted dehydrogenase